MGTTTNDLTETFQQRLRALANHERRRWSDNKERARDQLAAQLRATPRQVERWMTPGAIKEPRVGLWLKVEELWLAIADIYDDTCDRLEVAARKHNSDAACTAAKEGTHADSENGDSGLAGMDR